MRSSGLHEPVSQGIQLCHECERVASDDDDKYHEASLVITADGANIEAGELPVKRPCTSVMVEVQAGA